VKINEWEKEVNRILTLKVETIVKKFRDERVKDLIELATLSQKLEDLENKTNPFLKERDGLNMLKNADLARRNYLDGHIPWLEKQVKGIQDQIEKITQKLTKVEVDPNILAFLLNFKS
jgi:predicted  nucleic acid-binding Zn-ribbon protein